MRERYAFLCGLGPALLLASALHAAPSSGALRIQTQPHVQVIWDGVKLGTTDGAGSMRIEDIPPGQYRIQLQHAGYEPVDATVAVAAGESILEFQLQPVGAPTPTDVSSVKARPGGEDAAQVAQRREQAISTAAVEQSAVEQSAVEQPAPELHRPTETSRSAPPAPNAASQEKAARKQVQEPPASEPTAPVPAEGSIGWPWMMALYLVLAILLVGLGTLVVVRRTRPRGLLLQGSTGPFRQTSDRSSASARPPFFDEIKRREVALEQFVDTGRGVQRRAREVRERGELEEEGA